ncbi:MAG: OsmC family protein [Gammaproteobacteria bacterium]
MHTYRARIVWEGNTGEGTASYTAYTRDYRTVIDGKPDLPGSADPAFRGDAAKHNPEDLLVGALSACHMLFYLSLCAKAGIRVLAYEDDAEGTMEIEVGGGGRFTEVVLHPRVTVAADSDTALAESLHARAHELCFIANSCSMPIRHEPQIHSASYSKPPTCGASKL